MKKYKVIIQPGDVQLEALAGVSLMAVINEAGLDFDSPCGGGGRCGKCRVRLLKGAAEPTAAEVECLSSKELADGTRLACQTKVHQDITMELANNNKLEHKILMASEARHFPIKSHLKKTFVQVERPSLQDQRSDWQRLKDSLVNSGCKDCQDEAPIALLRQLPETLREAGHCLTAVMEGNKVLGIEPYNTTGTMLGMAIDIGTTTIVGYLLDLNSGQELSVISTLNPQTKFGADVISRISYASQEQDGLLKLHQAVIEAINGLIGEGAEKAGISRNDLYGVSVAANTCMHHLFLGINPKHIAKAPYVTVLSEPLVLDAINLNIAINQAGKIFVLPNIAGFVGADTTAVLVATELDLSENIKLVIDIGTNGEIALGSKTKLVACSAAAGPAFEGAQISSGMRGAVGAIDHVYFGDKLEYSVIGAVKPVGICGSALLDAVAGLVELGMIDKRGKFLAPEKLNPVAERFKEHLIEHEGAAAFVLAAANKTGHARPVIITQADIRELQLAKGAIAAGIRILMESLDIQLDDIKEVLLAGAFGNYLNPRSACILGLIPRELENRITMVGNAAGTGAKLALLSSSEYRRAAGIAKFVKFVELGSHPKFNRFFAEAAYFKVT